MSSWTHIVAAIDVDTNVRGYNLKRTVEFLLENSPKITGSEGNADIFVNMLSGYNHSTNMDCEVCKFHDTIIEKDDGTFSCNATDGFRCPEGKYQTRVVITVIGDLRDRWKNDTQKEWDSFYHFVKKEIKYNDGCGFWIRNVACKILGY